MIPIPEPLQFLVEIVTAELLVTYWLPRRRRWKLWLPIISVSLAGVALLWPAEWNGYIKMIKYLVLFLLSVTGIWMVYRIRFGAALYHGAAAYAAQHIAFQTMWVVYVSSHSYILPACTAWVPFIVYAAVYLLFYFLFVRKIRRDGLFGVDNLLLISFILLMLLAVIVLNYIRISVAHFDPVVENICSLYAILCCVFALFIQSGMSQQSQLSYRLDIAQHLLHSRETQYKVSEATIQSINLKCHDLKHQVAALRRSMNHTTAEQVLGELESAVQQYDSTIRTGNDALDVILTEKSLLCEKNGIQLTCMADASGLGGISDGELYSLFGNLLDNAIESAQSMPQKDQRTIGLTVKNTGSMTLIHTENYFNHPLIMEDGLPVTTKEDSRYHGFGMQSIRLLCERYGGTLSVHTDSNIFNVNILLPQTTTKTA